jgi:hypothetical protein
MTQQLQHMLEITRAHLEISYARPGKTVRCHSQQVIQINMDNGATGKLGSRDGAAMPCGTTAHLLC